MKFILFCFTPGLLLASISNYGNIPDVRYISNYDGDTIKVSIEGITPIFGSEIPVRLYGIDTPEIKSKDQCEKQKALEAKEIVRTLLVKAKKVSLRDIKRDKYFRILAKVYADDVNVSDELIKKHLAYEYNGDTKKKINWCKDTNTTER